MRRSLESVIDNGLNFAWHLAALSLLATIATAAARRRGLALASGGVTVALWAWIVRSRRHRAAVQPGGRHLLRVMTLNAYNRGAEIEERVAEYARAHEVDVLFLQEWDEPAALTLGHLHGYFTHHAVEVPDGTQIYSRLPLRVLGLHRSDDSSHQETMVHVALEVGDTEVTCFAIHPLQPVHPDRFGMRRREFEWLARLVAATPGPVIVAGDCNASVLSPEFQALLRRSGLRSVSSWPPEGTWPAPLGRAGIAIDHVLLRGLSASTFEVGPSLGSDHRVVVADISLADVAAVG
ncbi:MAG: endonuclease/exonuclease/phosphatase family protein [Dehalococcoidia bacterium]|nr:endonuclease/exonuclease/phosphatase family protein [Dehalococcoidia bacterium]